MPDIAAPADDQDTGIGGGNGGASSASGATRARVENLGSFLLWRGHAAAPLHSTHGVDPEKVF